MSYSNLVNPVTLEKKIEEITVTKKQLKIAKEWLSMLKKGELKEEEINYFRFGTLLLRDVLGYPEREIDFNVKHVEFSFKDKNGKYKVCFEAKGTKTKDLSARQNYKKGEQRTPIHQTLSNMFRFPSDFGVTTNYREFILFKLTEGIEKRHKFDFYEIEKNEEKLKEFISVFSYGNLVLSQETDRLIQESLRDEKKISKDFYKLFHETRLMLITEFRKKDKISKEEAIRYAQLFLIRLIFIFFVEDEKTINIPSFLFPERIHNIIKSGTITEHSQIIFNDINQNLFKGFDKGDLDLEINEFDGDLFKEQIPEKIYFFDQQKFSFFKGVVEKDILIKKKLNPISEKIIKGSGAKLNPIIKNLLLMDSYNFTTELNVNILGHIFEQSVSDLEKYRDEGISKRKTDGIYYTSEFLTDYICRNAIMPYFTNTQARTSTKIFDEYSENIDELEEKLKKIKILDPACGSGAFLIKVVDILLELHKQIQDFKEFQGEYSFSKKGKKSSSGTQYRITKWNEESEIRKIIENNVFGVDINGESIGITKLSLFLKTLIPNKKLNQDRKFIN